MERRMRGFFFEVCLAHFHIFYLFHIFYITLAIYWPQTFHLSCMGNLLRGVILIQFLLKRWVNDMHLMLPLKLVSLFLKELFYSLSWIESLCWPITKAHHTVTVKVPSLSVFWFVTGPISKALWKGCAELLEFQVVTSMEREWQRITQSGKMDEKWLLSAEIILTFAVFNHIYHLHFSVY